MPTETHEPKGKLWRADDYAADNPNSPRINATILSLVRNKEIDGMVQSMRDLEKTWNSKFNYPWTFFNDEPFTEEFKKRTSAETKAKCYYHTIPEEHWDVPAWINFDLFEESAKILMEQDIQYGNLVSYHQMCRWNSGLFYKHPALEHVRYYWRVEPKVHFFCDVDYDVFRYMEDNNKTYGFTINLYDAPQSMPTLWPETQRFIKAHPEYVKSDDVNARQWLEDAEQRPEHNKKASGYSTCHFWSNFEIADMNFWRSKAYEDYFNHLDRAGGFFYERWGDAPVHSIALGLFEDASKIHWYVNQVFSPFALFLQLSRRRYRLNSDDGTGFEILVTNIYHTSIVPTFRTNARAAKQAYLLMERLFCIKRIAGRIGSSMSEWIKRKANG
ncbi:MAG: hypothetical protein LQ351_005356 [Letrouitia transgressa]|nr:MAG: hypothetical protein LQ351_005356 [Letrouitia transgressa]